MTGEERIVDVALAAIAGGVTSYLDLVDHCLGRSELGEQADLLDVGPDEYLFQLLADVDLVRISEDDDVIRMDVLLDGVVFTHRLTESEIANDVVAAIPDLALIDADTDTLDVPGGQVRHEFDFGEDPHLSEHGSLVGPAGWLGGFVAGDIVAFRRDGSRLVVEPVGEVADGSEEIAAIEDAFAATTDDREDIGAEPGMVLERALIDHPWLFRRPVPPVSELFSAAGIDMTGAWAGRVGTDWKPPMVAFVDDLRDRLHTTYRLDECCDEALDIVIGAWSAQAGGGTIDSRSVNHALGHGPVIDAFCEWADELVGLGSPSIGELAAALSTSGRREVAPALMLRARHDEAAGDALGAHLHLQRAVQLDPDFGPALADLAWYASDRGDASRTVALLRRAGVGEDDPMLAFHASLGAQLPTVGRNEPCPCGSGRKHKVCHLGRIEIPVDQRVTWLISKLSTFVTRPDRVPRLYGLASSAMWPDFEVDDLARMVRDEFILELRMFEGGGVSEFLDERGVLVPEDELDVLESWDEARLAVWEVVAGDGEANLSVRSATTGETLDVTDRSMARSFQPGDQILARFLPAWERNWASGVVLRVDPRHRDTLLALLDEYPDADLIADWYGMLLTPPSFANREGEPLVWCEARVRPAIGWDELAGTLDDALHAAEDEPDVWRELFEVRPEEWIVRASLRRDGDELVIHANSEARLERVLALLAGVTDVMERTAKPLRDPTELAAAWEERLPAERTEPVVPLASLEGDVAEELADMMERRWIDERVPALGNLTPRRAADDPTRREDLVALLRSFDRMPASGGITMRPDVLRRHLGLQE